LDVLENLEFRPLAEKRVGVVTNHTALNRDGKHLVDLLHEAEQVTVTAIFAPEHGFRGGEEGGFKIDTHRDPVTDAPIYSLYGEVHKPTAEMVAGVDLLIFDIQDIGARFYTYISTMGFVMEAGAEYGIPVMILDRPNPISGRVEGPLLDLEFQSFVGKYPIPIRHGLTVAELARMIQGEDWVPGAAEVDLHIVQMEHWSRELFWSDMDLKWIDPSPNMRNLNEALTYPGLCLLEGTNINEGRGTVKPFEQIGTPWMDNQKVARLLLKTGVQGITVEPYQYTPVSMPGYSTSPRYMDELVNGILLHVTDPSHFDAVDFGLHFLAIMKKLYPDEFEWRSERGIDRLWGSASLRVGLDSGKSVEKIKAEYQSGLDEYLRNREQYLIYGSEHDRGKKDGEYQDE